MTDPVPSKKMLDKALSYVAILRQHDLTKYAKHPRQDYILALADEIERLQRQVEELSIHAEKWVKRALEQGAAPEPRERASVFVRATSDTEMFAVTAGQVTHYEQPAPEPGALQAEVDRMRKLFWLAKEEVIFFSGYDDKSDTWPNIDLYYSPCVNLGDTFAYACADGERLDDSEIDRLITAYKGWAYDGVVAWAALIRKCEPIKPRCTPQYHEARAALESGAAQPPGAE